MLISVKKLKLAGCYMDKRVLIVDDDKKLRDLLTEYLGECGFHVYTIPDGTDFTSGEEFTKVLSDGLDSTT